MVNSKKIFIHFLEFFWFYFFLKNSIWKTAEFIENRSKKSEFLSEKFFKFFLSLLITSLITNCFQMQQQQHQRNRNQPNMRGIRSGGQWNGKATMMMDTPPPPPPSSASGSGGVEKRNTCPSNLKDFNIRVLQIRYTSLVDRLVTKRADACKFCGMRLDDSNGKSKEWQDHMDWHVKQNLSRGTHSDQANYRPWYPTAANWLTARASDQPCKEEPRDEPLPGVASSGVNAKECAVCQEKFDEYFDDDEETWRLRDTVVVHGKVRHFFRNS